MIRDILEVFAMFMAVMISAAVMIVVFSVVAWNDCRTYAEIKGLEMNHTLTECYVKPVDGKWMTKKEHSVSMVSLILEGE